MRLWLGAFLLLLVLAGPAGAVPFRWASGVDVSTLDPHGVTDTNTVGVIMNIYEPLVRRNRNLEFEPGLATGWEIVAPNRWRFRLRQGVVFHDGTPLTMADVVFSLQRAQSDTSDVRPTVRSVAAIEPQDDWTFDLVTDGPNPILLSELSNFFIVNRAWTLANRAEQPFTPQRRLGVENFATFNANGTGPFRLVRFEQGRRIVLAANPRWWDQAEHNLTEVTIFPIASDATRVAALLSGEVDMVNPLPVQDIPRLEQNTALQVVTGPRRQVMYLDMDKRRDELLYSSVRGVNPFRDVRVRRAVYHAIDTEALRTRLLRSVATPVGSLIPPGVEGFDPEMLQRLPYNLEEARRLMAAAGYADGFSVQLDCTNDQYPADEAVCTAVAAMLARIGIRANAQPLTRARFFPKVTARDTSMMLMAWYAPTFDAHHILWNTLMTTGDGNGNWNIGGWSNPAFDDLVRGIAVTMDQGERRAMVREANRLVRDEVALVPLYQIMLVWGARRNVSLVPRPDNRLDLRYVRVN